MHEEVIATIPQEETDTLLEVVRVYESPGHPCITLRFYVWGNGVGWYRQHTLKLDEATARTLWRVLGRIQHRSGQYTAKGHSYVIPFPGVQRTPERTQGDLTGVRKSVVP